MSRHFAPEQKPVSGTVGAPVKNKACLRCSKRCQGRNDKRLAKPLIPQARESDVVCHSCYKRLRLDHDAVARQNPSHSIAIDFPDIMGKVTGLNSGEKLHMVKKLTAGGVFESLDNCAEIIPLMTMSAKANVLALLATDLAEELKQFVRDLEMERNFENLCFVKCKDYMQLCPPLLTSLLKSAFPTAPDRFVVKFLEAGARCVNGRFVSPLSFREMTVVQTLTLSKTARLLISQSLPCGSYSTFRRFLVSGSANSAFKADNCDFITAFDNQQIVGKTYSVKAFNVQPVSKCTAVVHKRCSDTKLQYEVQIPQGLAKQCATDAMTGTNLTLEEIEVTEAENRAVSTELKQTYSHILPLVQREFLPENRFKVASFFGVAKSIAERINNRFCFSCETLASGRRQRKCANCGAELPTVAESKGSLIRAIEDARSELPECCKLQVRPPSFAWIQKGRWIADQIVNDDPIFSLPASYSGTLDIVRELGKRLGVRKYGGQRNYAVLVCDGQPYVLMLNLIKEAVSCGTCGEAFQKIAHFREHSLSHSLQPLPEPELDWVVLQFGLGHFEMTFMKAIMKLTWTDYLSQTAEVLGFQTEKAQSYARSASDTHKTYELLVIFRHAMFFELCYHFLENYGPDFDYTTFSSFCRSCNNKTIQQTWIVLSRIVQPLFVFRGGVRRNNANRIHAAVKIALPVFQAAGSYKYVQICRHYLCQHSRLPDAVVQQLDAHLSTIRDENSETAQGMDFIMEEENRRAKHYLSPTAGQSDWMQTYRNLDRLERMRRVTFADLQATDPRGARKSRIKTHSNEVEKLRIFIRGSGIFEEDGNTTRNLSGDQLSKDYKQLLAIAEQSLAREVSAGNPDPSGECLSSDGEIEMDSDLSDAEFEF